MMTMAKGLTSGYMPMSAVMVGDRVSARLIADGGEFYHGFTYSGHPVAAAVALAMALAAPVIVALAETAPGLLQMLVTDLGPIQWPKAVHFC